MAGITARNTGKANQRRLLPLTRTSINRIPMVVRAGESIYEPFTLSYTGLARATHLDLRVFTRRREFAGEQMGTVKRSPDIVIVSANYQKRS